MKKSIQPVSFTILGKTFTAVEIAMYVTYVPGVSPMYVAYDLFNAEGVVVYHDFAEISEGELASWGSDDNYIFNLVASKAGVTLA